MEQSSSEEERWCQERRAQVAEYLRAEGIRHGRIGDWPAWHMSPYVSIWAIESGTTPDSVGWWVICGDGPTDYVSAKRVKDPRAAVQAFADRWNEVASYMLRAEPHPTIELDSPKTWVELGPLLKRRAELLSSSAADDSVWQPAP